MRRLRSPEDQRRERGTLAPLASAVLAAMRARNWVTGLAVPILAAIAVGIAVVVIAGANTGSGGTAPPSLAAGFPPARSAAADFSGTAALAGRGISAPLGQVATFDGTTVAVGAQAGTRISRARFFFSTDSGRGWQLGTVPVGAAPGHAATLVAGGARGWVAVGPASVWISQNGRGWLPEPALPQLAGDQITTLISTGSGFLAAGTNIPGGDAAKASPVVWLSANGTTWQRLGGTGLGLAAGSGRVLGITAAAANGGTILLAGTVAGATTGSGTWRSANGGTTWTAVTIPAGGAAATISGIAPLSAGFVAVRPAQVAGSAGAAVYTSPDGATWHKAASLRTADGATLTIGLVSGGPSGAVVTGRAHGFLIAFLSKDGVTWTGTDPVGTAGTERVSGVALLPTGQAVFSGTSAGDAARQEPVLTLIGAQGGPVQINLRAMIPKAFIPQLAVNAIAASGATQVAAGGADGLPALWISGDGGSTWARSAGATAVLTRPGVEQLTGVAHGAAGWLAVGGAATATAEHPVVVGSADSKTWTAADGAAAFTGQGLVTAAVAAGPGGYVIVGHETAGGRTIAAAWQSAGLAGWQRAADGQPGALDGAGNRQMGAVAATGQGFVAVGSAGSRPAAWLSATGRTWSLVTLPLPAGSVSAELQFAAANGDTVAALGAEVTATGQRIPFAAVSTNGGAGWAETVLPAPHAATGAAVTALAAAGGGFTATGTYGAAGDEDVVVWTLAPGAAPRTTWTAAAPDGVGLAGQGTQAITALTATGSTLTGVGFIATATSEQPTIWQSPVRN
ncbi:MAG TPA: hypothetical protein VKG80_05620 [Trebonia sp.]|nr:hypothetical protein [Trebonia sp.]